MSLSKIARPLTLLTLLAVAVFGSASRSDAGIVFSTDNNNYTQQINMRGETGLVIAGDAVAQGPVIYFSGNNQAISLSSSNGVSQVFATDPVNTNLRMLTLTAQAGFGISAMNWSLYGEDNKGSGSLTFKAYDAMGQEIGTSSPFSFTGKNRTRFDFTTNAGSLVSKFEIISDGTDIGDLKQMTLSTQSIQSVPEPTSTLAFAGVAAMCGLYRLRRRNRKAEK